MKIPLKWQVFILFLLPMQAVCQSRELPRAIPLEMETYLFHNTYIKITYSAIGITPENVNKIIKEGQLWQLGANEPAELITTQDILINKDTLKAGAYSLFVIPEDTIWTVICNADVGLFGVYRYNEERDVLRMEVPVAHANEFRNTLTLYFDTKGIPDTRLSIAWLDKKVSIPVKIIK